MASEPVPLNGLDKNKELQEAEPEARTADAASAATAAIDAAVTAMGPDGLIFGLLGQEIAVLVVEYARALDHASLVASMGGQSAPGGFQFSLGFTAEFGRAVKLPGGKIIGRIPARFVDHIGQHVGTVSRQALTTDRMFFKSLYKGLVGFAEFVRISGLTF